MATYKLATFSAAGSPPFGALVVGDRAVAFAAVARFAHQAGLAFLTDGSTLSVVDAWQVNQPALQKAADELAAGSKGSLFEVAVPVSGLRLEAPIRSRTVVCAGANYFKHVVDLIVAQKTAETEGMDEAQRRAFGIEKMTHRRNHGTPFFFIKASSTMIGPLDDVSLPPDVTSVDWELELGVVIGKRARFVKQADALDYVAGYMVVNDITIRERVNRKDVKEMGMDWVAAKCAPTALPSGPYLVPAQFVGDPQKLWINLKHNGKLMQDEGTADMIFPVTRLIEALSKLMVLEPGDLICTGSPSGNGMHHGVMLKTGDVMEGTITGASEGFGTQRNACVDERL